MEGGNFNIGGKETIIILLYFIGHAVLKFECSKYYIEWSTF